MKHNSYYRSLEKGNGSSSSDKNSESTVNSNSKEANKKPHIKKPLNAFMLYMKEMRAKVVAECTLKESAAINQILGRRVSDMSNSSSLYNLYFCSVFTKNQKKHFWAFNRLLKFSIRDIIFDCYSRQELVAIK